MSVSVTLVALHVIHVPAAATLPAVPGIVPILVALITLYVVHVGAASEGPWWGSSGGLRLASCVGRNLTARSLGPLHLHLVTVQLAAVHFLDSILRVPGAPVLDESVSEGAFGEPHFVQVPKVLELALHLPPVRVRT